MEFNEAADTVFEAILKKTNEGQDFDMAIESSQYIKKFYEGLYEIEQEVFIAGGGCSPCPNPPKCRLARRQTVISYVVRAMERSPQFSENSLDVNIDKVLNALKVVYNNMSQISIDLDGPAPSDNQQ